MNGAYAVPSVKSEHAGYKKPEATIIVLGEPVGVEQLRTIVWKYGSRGVKIVIFSNERSSRVLEDLRELILSNIAFTIELYHLKTSTLSEVLKREEDRVVEVVVFDSSLINTLPPSLKLKVDIH